MTTELTMASAMESNYTQLGLEGGFISSLKDIFTIGRDERAYNDVKTFNTLKKNDINMAPKSVVKYLNDKGYMDARVLRLTKPVELAKSYPEVLSAIVGVISITDDEFVRLYVTPLQRLLGTLVNNTSKLDSMSPITINSTYDFQKTKKDHDALFNSYKDCLSGKGDPFSTFGDLYPNASTFTGFGLNLRGYHSQVTDFNIGRSNAAINDVYDLLNDLYTSIKTDKKIKVSKTVAKQVEEMTILMSAAGDLYVTCSQQFRVIVSSHNEHIARLEQFAKK